jgi:Uma2 family endonuclease
MTAPAIKHMSVAEFLAWAETQDAGRYELVRGEVVAMAPERAEHGRTKANIWRAFDEAIKRAGLPCEAFVDSLGVAIDAQTAYIPDVLVNCGETVAPDSMLASSPIVLVEVLSPSSRNIDKSVKLADYFRLPSVAHYLIVDLGRRLVLHYRRKGDEPITVTIVKEGVIALDPPGLEITMSDIFAS